MFIAFLNIAPVARESNPFWGLLRSSVPPLLRPSAPPSLLRPRHQDTPRHQNSDRSATGSGHA